ncbi:Cbr1 [Scenedesmus sp. PABB004]|nr:Cbr1 [Scenedesmus sp. PABB004]
MPDKWWDASTVAVVTGANKGIGFEIARLLAEAGLSVVLTSRSEERGAAALAKLAGGSTAGGAALAVEYRQLDIASPASVAAFAEWLSDAKGGRLDVLVNNAGIAFKGSTFGADEAAATIATNFGGTRAACEALAPLLAPGGRIVNVSSSSGLLRGIPSEQLRARFDAPSGGVDELVQLGNAFVADVQAGRHAEAGWPNSMYGVSKALESSYTRLLAKELAPRGIMVNACCPGYCATDMSSWRGTQSAAAGADTPVWLALTPPEDFKTGGFYRDRTLQSWT